jgi:hypothetical protein
MKREIIQEIFWYLFVIVVVVSFSVCGWWVYYPYEPIVVKSLKIMNPDKKVVAGKHLTYCIEYEKKMNVHGVLVRKLLNDFIIDLRASDGTAPIGKDKVKVEISIPPYAAPGKYTLWWASTYKVNPLRSVTVTAESDEFEIVENHELLRGKTGIQGIQGKTGKDGKDGKTGENFWGNRR